MKALITGACGFLGTNIVAEALKRGWELFLVDNLSRKGSSENLEWLRKQGTFKFSQMAVQDQGKIEILIKDFSPEVIFHLAGQVAMTTSLNDPRSDFDTNVVGSMNILEAVRKYAPGAILTYSSTNKVYGEMRGVDYREKALRYEACEYTNGFSEKLGLDFQSPYGCSKGAVDQYMLDYARSFGLRTIVFRHSSIFGGRQFSTFDQGWIGWFVEQALETKGNPTRPPFSISGDGKQVRDILFASDLTTLYFKAVECANRASGQAFNIGGGMENSLSLLELFAFLEQELDIKLNYHHLPWRNGDQKVFVADIAKAKELIGWSPKVLKNDGLREMIRWVQELRSTQK